MPFLYVPDLTSKQRSERGSYLGAWSCMHIIPLTQLYAWLLGEENVGAARPYSIQLLLLDNLPYHLNIYKKPFWAVQTQICLESCSGISAYTSTASFKEGMDNYLYMFFVVSSLEDISVYIISRGPEIQCFYTYVQPRHLSFFNFILLIVWHRLCWC